jgi:hypothetical protein
MSLAPGATAMSEPENIVLTLLREMRAEIATKADVTRLDDTAK